MVRVVVKFKTGDKVKLIRGEYVGIPLGSIGVVQFVGTKDHRFMTVRFTPKYKGYPKTFDVTAVVGQLELVSKLQKVLE